MTGVADVEANDLLDKSMQLNDDGLLDPLAALGTALKCLFQMIRHLKQNQKLPGLQKQAEQMQQS